MYCSAPTPRQDHEHQNIKIMLRTNSWRGDMVHSKNLILMAWIGFISISLSAQEKNQIVYDSVRSQSIILGFCYRPFLEQFSPFNLNYSDEYQNYKSGLEPSPRLDSLTSGLFITIVLATWCGDSKEQVPRFFRILDDIGFPTERVSLICVDGRKQCDTPDVLPLHIERVPTFIFYKGCREIGRIIETPVVTLEADFLAIIERKNP